MSMKLGSQTGSVINHIQSRMTIGAPEPTVGLGVTLLHWTDRSPATIVAWDGKILTVQADNATRTDKNGMSESQDYTYTPNPAGALSYFKKDRKGAWREIVKNENGRWVFLDGDGLFIGDREKYRDFSF